MNAPTEYLLHLADNALILGQRNAEWCGHGPILEEDIALSNNSLDLIGHLANFLWPAAVTAAVAAGLAKWLWREELRHTRGWRLAAWAGAAGTASATEACFLALV